MQKIILTGISSFILCIATTVFAMPSGEQVTIVGKITKNEKRYIEINVKGDAPYILDTDDLNKTTKEFRQCIYNGKYQGMIEITTISGFSTTAYETNLQLNSKSVCKRK